MADETESAEAALETSKVITLRQSIKFGDKTYDHIELHEPTAGDLAEAAKAMESVVHMNIELVARSARVPAAVIKKMPATEYHEAIAFIAPFANGNLQT